MPDLSDTIEQAAADPRIVEVDGQHVEAKPIGDLIAADKYLAGKAALSGSNARGGPRSGWGSLRAARVVPQGAAPLP